MNFLKAIADGNTQGLSSSHIISKYKLGSSANVAAIHKALTDGDFISETNGHTTMTDSVMALWFKRI